MSIGALVLRAVAEKERPRFEARLSVNLAEGCRGRRVKVNGSLGASLTLVANDSTASFPLNRSAAAAAATTTVTDDTASGNGFGFTVLLVCAVWSCRVLSIGASGRSDEPIGTHDYSSPTLLTLHARNIIDE